MKEREAVDDGVALAIAKHLGETEGSVDLVAMRKPHKFRATGRAAGMEECADLVAVGRRREIERVACFAAYRMVEIDETGASAARATNHDDVLERRHLFENARSL